MRNLFRTISEIGVLLACAYLGLQISINLDTIFQSRCKPMTVLVAQTVAAILMATDYFIAEDRRRNLNKKLQKAVRKFRFMAYLQLKDSLTDLRDPLLLDVLVIVGGTFAIAMTIVHYEASWVLMPITIKILLPTAFLVMLYAGIILGAPMKLPSRLLSAALLKAAIGISNFLIKCPKGTVLGFGFVILALSFLCRYRDLV